MKKKERFLGGVNSLFCVKETTFKDGELKGVSVRDLEGTASGPRTSNTMNI